MNPLPPIGAFDSLYVVCVVFGENPLRHTIYFACFSDALTFRMKSHKDELLCTHSPISSNVTLRGGEKAGNLSNLGEVDSMHMCTALCCAKATCDLAFMIGDSCVAVECASEELCQTVRARPTDFNPKISYIRRREINQNVKKGEYNQIHVKAL